MPMMAILCCVYSYGMKSGSESLYGVCTMLFLSEPAILAQADGTRLGETCRDSYSYPTRGSRLGEENWVLATQTLAQASEVRLSEIVMKLCVLSATSRLGEGVWVLSELGSRPGEMDSPKRDAVVMCDALFVFLAQASLKWVFR
ncbi:hypothetical protein DEO72_LG2g3742 [Vigna unguiculata]|uniref:Uncharacterized protein n=1 Tax=Vigna unguiculata TaxID=3917 RepID=A0A4D6L4J1_VIGUN|nr:hypothetical protein DEO72_LG2g3742 [Vigna unguiculata]